LTEPIYFERDRYDLPIPLFELNPHPASGEITFIQTKDLSEQQHLIFQVLQQIFSPLGVRFEFSLQHQPQMAEFTNDEAQTMFQSADAYWQALEYRLWIRCYAQTALDSQLIAEPLAKQLRRLNFQHFQDAIVQFSRFSSRSAMGNQIPDWRLRIDLTPPTVRLRSWARWGDVQAITKLLNLALVPEAIQVSTVLKNLTLQIFCTLKNPQSAKFPAKKVVLDTIAPLLISLTPQGIQAATIHGIQSQPDLVEMEEPPVWIHWLDLPALGDPNYSPTPIAIAARGDEEALRFILERLLNPDLERCFESGGISISLLLQPPLLHVMSEASICPIQSQIATTVVKVIRQLQLPTIRGVRVHGRISGQSISRWTYGVDFDMPQLVLPPIVTPPRQPPRTKLERVNWSQKISAYLAKTGVWQPQLTIEKTSQLVYHPRFEWQPSLLLLAMGLGLTIGSDFVVKYALAARHLTVNSATTTAQLSFNNPLLEQKLAQYQLRCLQHGVPDVLIVGSSRALRGVDPEVLRRSLIDRGYRNPKLYNFGINGATAQVVDLILRQLLTPQQLPKLVIWADGARAFNSGRIDRTYDAIATSDRYRQLALISGIKDENSSLFQAQSSFQNTYRAIDNAFDRRLDRFSSAYHHRDRIKTWLQSKIPATLQISDRNNTAIEADSAASLEAMEDKRHPREIDFDGFLAIDLQFDPTTYYQKYTKVTGESDGDYANFQLLGLQQRALDRTIELLDSHKVPLVFVNLPLSDIYLDKARRQHEVIFKEYMQKLTDSQRITFIDMDGVLDRNYDRFSDPSHLNQIGASDVSRYLARVEGIPWKGTSVIKANSNLK
jgi:Protein of unknown function (DUF1574)